MTSETYGGRKESNVSFQDHSGDLWQLLCTAVAEGPVNSRGRNFLISPCYKVISFEQFSPRVSLVSFTSDAFWQSQNGIDPDRMGKCVKGIISVYMQPI